MARRFEGRVPRADLEQAGVIGLLRAARSFDPVQGTPFGGYAAPFVMGEMLACVRQQATPVRVPRSVADDERTVTAAIDALTGDLGRSPTVDEIASRSELGQDAVLDALRLRLAARPVPLRRRAGRAVAVRSGARRRSSSGSTWVPGSTASTSAAAGWWCCGSGWSCRSARSRTGSASRRCMCHGCCGQAWQHWPRSSGDARSLDRCTRRPAAEDITAAWNCSSSGRTTAQT